MAWLTRAALRWGSRLYIWGAVRMRSLPVADRARAAGLIGVELRVIPEAVRRNLIYRDAEVRLQTERLMRRYDLGGALNEAAQRAMEDKKTQVPPGYPTELQKRALEVQAQTLKDRIKATPSSSTGT